MLVLNNKALVNEKKIFYVTKTLFHCPLYLVSFALTETTDFISHRFRLVINPSMPLVTTKKETTDYCFVGPSNHLTRWLLQSTKERCYERRGRFEDLRAMIEWSFPLPGLGVSVSILAVVCQLLRTGACFFSTTTRHGQELSASYHLKILLLPTQK
jgi:hypothetical protein